MDSLKNNKSNLNHQFLCQRQDSAVLLKKRPWKKDYTLFIYNLPNIDFK